MRFPMPFQGTEASREEACRLALVEGANRRQLCRRFGISAKTLYRWLPRYEAEGVAGLVDRSHRPQRSPRRTDDAKEAAVLAVRHENPVWGGRKIAAALCRQGLSAAHVDQDPCDGLGDASRLEEAFEIGTAYRWCETRFARLADIAKSPPIGERGVGWELGEYPRPSPRPYVATPSGHQGSAITCGELTQRRPSP